MKKNNRKKKRVFVDPDNSDSHRVCVTQVTHTLTLTQKWLTSQVSYHDTFIPLFLSVSCHPACPLWNYQYMSVIAHKTSMHYFKTKSSYANTHTHINIHPLHSHMHIKTSNSLSIYKYTCIYFWVRVAFLCIRAQTHTNRGSLACWWCRTHVFWWYESWPHLHANRSSRLIGSTCEGEGRLHGNKLLWLLNTFTDVLT